MLNRGSEKMTPIEAFLYEMHIKEVQDEYCDLNMPENSVKDYENYSDFEILTYESERIAAGPNPY